MTEPFPETTAPTERISPVPTAVADAFDEPEDQEFVPAPRWRPGRATKVLAGVCLVLAGGLGGAALQKAVDARSGTAGRAGQFQVGTQSGGTGASDQTGSTDRRGQRSQAPSSPSPSALPSTAASGS